MGNQLKLTPASNDNEIEGASGVAGETTYLVRNCEIFLFNRRNKKMYMYQDVVWWIYPNSKAQEHITYLATRVATLKNLKNQCKTDTDLSRYFDEEIVKAENAYKNAINVYETDVLIGRPFLDNFDYVQFFHRDRAKEDECFFKYKLTNKKIKRTITVPK
jgi:hypothetical protein